MKNRSMVVKGLVKSARKLRAELENMLEELNGQYTDDVHAIATKLDRCERLMKEQYEGAVNMMDPSDMVNIRGISKLQDEVVSYLGDAGLIRKEDKGSSLEEELAPILGLLGMLSKREQRSGCSNRTSRAHL